ncbi:MAG: ABC transporter ATP-binding protein [Clostridia bacterium]|nr:ABC transporter ATP-binding protein [Clostridia bacterium]
MIQLKNIQKKYGDFRLDVSLELPPGKVSGLVGRNGSGKSTTIKAILGLINVEGSARVFGLDPKGLTPENKMKIGVAFSDSGFSSYLRVSDVVRILKNSYRDFDEAFFLDYCEKYNLPTDKKIKEFSTGMSARLRVLIALSHNADLLILDEPTSGLDVVARGEILDMLRNYLAAEPTRALLISSHISSDLEGLCDDIYMIHDGKIVMHEDTDVILADYAVLKLTEESYKKIDRQYILKTKKEGFGYTCFTNQRKFYEENYPEVIIENGSIDEMIIMMSEGGEK